MIWKTQIILLFSKMVLNYVGRVVILYLINIVSWLCIFLFLLFVPVFDAPQEKRVRSEGEEDEVDADQHPDGDGGHTLNVGHLTEK